MNIEKYDGERNDGNEKYSKNPSRLGRFWNSISLPPLVDQLQHFRYELQDYTDFAFHRPFLHLFTLSRGGFPPLPFGIDSSYIKRNMSLKNERCTKYVK